MMKIGINISENEKITKIGKMIIRDAPFIIATADPIVGNLAGIIKDIHDEYILDNKFESLEQKIVDFQSQFDEFKKEFVNTNETYEIRNVNCIEVFFADYVETDLDEFIENLKEVLTEINEESTVWGTYGCVYKEYILYKDRIEIIFEEAYEKEFVEEFIQKIIDGIENGWHNTSPISKVRYY